MSILAGLGLALLFTWLNKKQPRLGTVMLAVAVLGLLFIAQKHYPEVTDITHDRSIETTITMADRASNPDRPLALMSLWGNTYWGLAYAQEYRGQFEDVLLVNDRADFPALVESGHALVLLGEVFYHFPLDYWQEHLGIALYPDTVAPGLIELRTEPRMALNAADSFAVNDDLSIISAEIQAGEGDELLLTVQWQADSPPSHNYSIAVHLLAADPPTGPQDILDQDDKIHPVDGLYPTVQWQQDQVVQDVYHLVAPPGTQPVKVRITAYYVDDANTFVNGNWFTLEIGQ